MTGTKGNVFMTLVPLTPPSIVALMLWRNPLAFQNSSVITLTIFGLAYVWVITQIVIPFWFSPLRHLPTPPFEKFIWAHGWKVFQRPPGTGMVEIAEATPNDGLIMFRGMFHARTSLILTSPQSLMEVMNTNCYDWEKPGPARRFLARVLGEGLINVEGQEHKAQRRAVAPAFSGRVIRDLVPLFWRKGQDFANRLAYETSTTDGEIEIRGAVSRVTLDIIGAACLGKDFGTLENADNELARLYELITDTKKGSMITYFVVNMIFPQWVVRHLPWKINRMVAHATQRLRFLCKELLAEKKQAMQMKTAEQKDIIGVIMRSADFSDDYLTDQILTFLAAGHETTASALTWTAYLLSTHPEVQTRLRKECEAVLGGRDEVDADLIDSIPYLHAVCNETLRFYPTVPGTARVSNRKTKIGNVVVPKGTFALITPWMVNRSKELWGPDADKFNPDRWMAGPNAATGGAPSQYGFLTFLHGPRSCIGQAFARSEFKCLLATFVMRFQWRMKNPNEEVVPEGVVTIKPRDGMTLILTDLHPAKSG